jgi:hypothetical protein
MKGLKTWGKMLLNIVRIFTNFLYHDQSTLLFTGITEQFIHAKKKWNQQFFVRSNSWRGLHVQSEHGWFDKYMLICDGDHSCHRQINTNNFLIDQPYGFWA